MLADRPHSPPTCLTTGGGEIAQLSRETFDAFNKLLPAHGSRNNPVDLLGDAGPERYAKALEIVAKDPNSDGVLVILTPQAMTEPTATAEQLKRFAKFNGKPILASWMGGDQVSQLAKRSSTMPASRPSPIRIRPCARLLTCGGTLTIYGASTKRRPSVQTPTTSLLSVPKWPRSSERRVEESALFSQRSNRRKFSPPMAFRCRDPHRI